MREYLEGLFFWFAVALVWLVRSLASWAVWTVVVVLLCARFSGGAPVPAVPRPAVPLSPEVLVGTWRFEWPALRDGQISFFADGSYVSHHGYPGWYLGRWQLLEGGVLVILEQTCGPDGRLGDTFYRYVVTLSTDSYPVVTGLTAHGGLVTLTRKR